MFNYILADSKRVLKKKSFLFVILFIILLFEVLVFILNNDMFGASDYLGVTDMLSTFFPLFVGVPIFLSVYNDDFKSGSMQVAIGYGISRKKVVLTKFLDTVILSSLGGVLYGLVFTITPLILGISLTSESIGYLLLSLGSNVVLMIGFITISTILVFATENAISGIILFILLSSKTISTIMSLVLSRDFMINLVGDLNPYMFSKALQSQVQNILEVGHANLGLILILLAYIALPLIISMLLFEKKELEF